MISWLFALPWLRRIGIWLAALAGIFITLIAIQKSGERAGRLRERLDQQQEKSDATERMLEVSNDRPDDRDDLARRMRDGSY